MGSELSFFTQTVLCVTVNGFHVQNVVKAVHHALAHAGVTQFR